MLVFDGWKSGKGGEVSSVKGGVNVIFSGLGEKADSVIKRIISAERREWIVVSSDREIAAHAWATDSIPVPSEAFLPLLESGGASPGLPPSEEERGDAEPEGQRKGNSRKLSRKEKMMNRALGKL